MRLAVYTDYPYYRVDNRVFAERAFALFLARLSREFDRFVLVGRETPDSSRARYEIGEGVELVSLPYYPSLSQPRAVLASSVTSIARFWRALRGIETVWLLGPHPLAIVFAATAVARRKTVVLGVRQDMRSYVESRHQHRRSLRLAGALLDWAWRWLSRLCPVVVVGPAIAKQYAAARQLLELTVSLVDESDLVPSAVALRRSYRGQLEVLSVGRLEPEKNPLLLADVLARLLLSSSRWRLTVCGEGSMRANLEQRLHDLGIGGQAQVLGYVPYGPPLLTRYRQSRALLHVSWTEGLPQVLTEAFAAGLPVVATDVGGVAQAVGQAVSLVPPGDAEAAAGALEAIAADGALRERLIVAGLNYARTRTTAVEASRLAAFLRQR